MRTLTICFTLLCLSCANQDVSTDEILVPELEDVMRYSSMESTSSRTDVDNFVDKLAAAAASSASA